MTHFLIKHMKPFNPLIPKGQTLLQPPSSLVCRWGLPTSIDVWLFWFAHHLP